MTAPDNNKAVPIRLGELKPLLQKEACSDGRSLNNLIVKICKEYLEKKEVKKTG